MSRPREGWLSLALVAVMAVTLAWSVESAAWLDHLRFLVPLVIAAVLVGGVLALTRLPTSLALAGGGFVGALLTVWYVGTEYYPAARGWERIGAVYADAVAWFEIVLLGGYPDQVILYALLLGALLWSVGFMAAFALLRHHRALDAVLLVGGALIVNMSATYTDLMGYLLIFTVAALLLLLRVTLGERERGWQARRIVENDDVPGAIMRNGLVFAVGSMVLAWTLTSVAVAAPLSDAWRSLDTVWEDVSASLDRFFGTVTTPSSRIGGTAFGPTLTVAGSWLSRDEVVMQVAAQQGYYMRAITYDRYTGRGWERSAGSERRVDVGELVFPESTLTPERPTRLEAFERVTITVSIEKPTGRNIFTPGFPVHVFAPVVVHETAGLPVLGGLEAASAVRPGEGYQITAEVSGATERELSEAGTDYPPEIATLYLDTSLVSQGTRDLATETVAAAGATTPYETARALSDYLRRDESFTYSTEAPLPDDPNQDLVDFFLFDADEGRLGYCEYYATAMVMMARSVGLPARLAVGFAPGTPNAEGQYTVRERDAHAWAEIYFPGFGWQIFEATKSINPGFGRASGEAPRDQAALDRRFLSGVDPIDDLGATSTLPSIRPIAGGTTFDQPAVEERARGGNLAIMALLAVLGGSAIFFLQRRARRQWALLPPNERAWRRMELAVVRAGVRQRPTETVYEYAGWLEAQIPARRPEIRTIAEGKVWSDYSGRPTSDDLESRVTRAWRRLRRPLWQLALRRRVRSLLRRRRR